MDITGANLNIYTDIELWDATAAPISKGTHRTLAQLRNGQPPSSGGWPQGYVSSRSNGVA